MKKKMKYTLGAVVLLVAGLSTHAVRAQGARMGVKGGLNISNLYVDKITDENARIGFNVGLYGQLPSSDIFAIQPEFLYSTRGTRYASNGLVDQSAKLNLDYLDLPVLVFIIKS